MKETYLVVSIVITALVGTLYSTELAEKANKRAETAESQAEQLKRDIVVMAAQRQWECDAPKSEAMRDAVAEPPLRMPGYNH